uniref:Uncharacterized protein n=1 Tax=Kalanchoe fedtschenkoi TaxID=63787 RepID=A0A7N0TIM7_KALFE
MEYIFHLESEACFRVKEFTRNNKLQALQARPTASFHLKLDSDTNYPHPFLPQLSPSISFSPNYHNLFLISSNRGAIITEYEGGDAIVTRSEGSCGIVARSEGGGTIVAGSGDGRAIVAGSESKGATMIGFEDGGVNASRFEDR